MKTSQVSSEIERSTPMYYLGRFGRVGIVTVLVLIMLVLVLVVLERRCSMGTNAKS